MFTISNVSAAPVGPLGFVANATIAASATYVVSDAAADDFLYDPDLYVAIQSNQVAIVVGAKTLPGQLAQTYLEAMQRTRPQPRDADGSLINRNKTTKTGWHFEPRSIGWTTGLLGSLHNKTHLDVDIGDATVKYIDGSNAVLTQGGGESDVDYQTRLDANCVVTVMDWWPAYDQDPISGVLWVKGVTAPSAYLYAQIAPDIPANLGGSVMLNNGGLDLSFFFDSGTSQNTGLFKSDGRGVKTLVYDPVYKSNKLRVWIRHPLAYRTGLQLTYEGFKG